MNVRPRNRCPSALLLALCAGLVACNRVTEETTPTQPSKIAVKVVRVRRGNIADERTVTGQTAALSTVRLASPIAGRIVSIAVLPGDQIDAGAVAARLIPLQNEAALDGLRALRRSENPSERQRALDARVEAQLGGTVALRAPLRAVVSARLHNPGEQVTIGDVVLELFDPTSLYVLAQIPAQWAADVHPGTIADIRSAAGNFSGRVAALLPTVEARSLTVPARIEMTTPMKPALLNAAVECRLTLDRHEGALLIPLAALLSSHVSDRGVVMVADGGRARSREVQLGLRNSDEVEVTGALAEDELVAIDGQYGLPDGTSIEPLLGQ